MISKIYRFFTIFSIILWLLFIFSGIIIKFSDINLKLNPGYGYLFSNILLPIIILLFIISIIYNLIKKNYYEFKRNIIFFSLTSILTIIITVIFYYSIKLL